MHIGRKGTGEQFFFFKGAIDDVRLYDRVLSEADVRELRDEGGWTSRRRVTANADPLSGRWGRDGVVFLDLRFDGHRAVTGRIMSGRPDNMAAIVSGEFDPTTGALRLSGVAKEPRSDEMHDYLIEGMLDGGEITVVAHFGTFEGNFMLARRAATLQFSRRSLRSQLGALAYRLGLS